jgi:hypothetical protein
MTKNEMIKLILDNAEIILKEVKDYINEWNLWIFADKKESAAWVSWHWSKEKPISPFYIGKVLVPDYSKYSSSEIIKDIIYHID